jgi:arylsulfatase
MTGDQMNGHGPAYAGFDGTIARTVAGSTRAWEPPRESGRRPNVVVILCDDLGFSDLGCYGSEIETPNLDALAAGGAQFSNFHSTPMCSPSRAALLTGMNAHAAGVGTLAGYDVGFPGYRGRLADDVATAAEVLRHNGYRTLMAGKWHLSHVSDHADAGSKDDWPLQRGFDRFYGFMESGLTNLHEPNLLHEDNHAVDVDQYPPGYYFTDDITERAIQMIRGVKDADPSKPFFLYFAHGAVHAPLMAKPEDIEKYRGRYDAGWDAIRAARFARQKKLGVIPADAELPARNGEPGHESVPWDTLDERERELFARYMEVYAGMVDSIDQSWGRLRDALAELGELDDTIVVFTSDNGASREGGARGTTEYYRTASAVHLYDDEPDDVFERDHSRLDLIGGPRVMAHYPWAWAEASNTPFRLHKGTTFQGGHHVAGLVSWPNGVECPGIVRHQFTHLIDVLPTLHDLLELELPTQRNGRPLKPMTGTSFAPLLKDPSLPGAHSEQYFEMNGHRGYYREGWEIVTLHYPGSDVDEERWQLFDLIADPAQARDLADRFPDRVADLARCFDAAAWENQVYPLGDMASMFLPLLPMLPPPRTLTLRPGSPTLERSTAGHITTFRSFTVRARLTHDDAARGILVSHGDQGGGYLLYVDDGGALTYAHNGFGELTVVDAGPLTAGPVEVELEVTAASLQTWDVRVLVDGTERAARTGLVALAMLAPFEGIDIGRSRRSPVHWELRARHGAYPYGGEIHTVTYVPGALSFPAPQMAEHVRELDTQFQ